MKKIILVGGFAVLVLAGVYIYRRKKAAATTPNTTTGDTQNTDSNSTSDTSTRIANQNTGIVPGSSSETDTFNKLMTIIKGDSNVKMGGFADAVQAQLSDYKAGKPGRYNASGMYSPYGSVGAFMAVADAWQSGMGFSEATHSQLWEVFNSYK